MSTLLLRRLTLAVAAGSVLVLSACGSTGSSETATDAASSPSPATETEAATETEVETETATESATFSPEEVTAASGSYAVKPIFAVPRELEEPYLLAFINPSISFPFFKEWSDGMNAAADFYGVELIEADLDFNYEDTLSKWEQMAIQEPDALGGHPLNVPVVEAATAAGIPVVTIDSRVEGAEFLGVDDTQVGELAITTLTPAVTEKRSGDWQGRDVIVVGISAPNCAPCDARIDASLAKAVADWGIPEDQTYMIVPEDADPTLGAEQVFTDFMTSHPDKAIVVVSYGDAPVIGAVNAAKAAGRTDDFIGLMNGGDPAARQALRDPSNAGLLFGAIDYQPFQEGWNWVEAAIASILGEDFNPYIVDRVLTSENVDTFYPNDEQ